MPRISTPSKIAGTQSHGAEVIFSGSTSVEREAVVAEIQAKTDAILVPPYDDFNVICGQGTTGLELEVQHAEQAGSRTLDAVITPIGGGGLNSGVATWFSDKQTRVFGVRCHRRADQVSHAVGYRAHEGCCRAECSGWTSCVSL